MKNRFLILKKQDGFMMNKIVDLNGAVLKAVWLRCFIGAAFASLKKFTAHFFNHACGITEPKDAPYETTGGECEEVVRGDTNHGDGCSAFISEIPIVSFVFAFMK